MAKPGTLEMEIRTRIRRLGMARTTEKSYVSWYRRFVKFHGLTHPAEMREREVEAFLSDLATAKRVAGSTQNQAFSAILFLYREVLKIELTGIDARRAKVRKKLPVVLSKEETRRVLREVPVGVPRLMLGLLYGCGLRVTEGLRLRVKDLDFANGIILVRDGKGGKDRVLTLPKNLMAGLQRQVASSRLLYEQDEAEGGARVFVPEALDRKSGGSFSKNFEWFWVFPAAGRSVDLRDGVVKRHHILEGAVSKWLKKAVGAAGIAKRVTAHVLRHSYATHLHQNGVNIRTIQEAMGHADVKTTEIYTKTN